MMRRNKDIARTQWNRNEWHEPFRGKSSMIPCLKINFSNAYDRVAELFILEEDGWRPPSSVRDSLDSQRDRKDSLVRKAVRSERWDRVLLQFKADICLDNVSQMDGKVGRFKRSLSQARSISWSNDFGSFFSFFGRLSLKITCS